MKKSLIGKEPDNKFLYKFCALLHPGVRCNVILGGAMYEYMLN